MTNYNDQDQFTSSTENTLVIEEKEHEVLYVTIEDPWMEELGLSLAYLYGLICALSIAQPYCYASTLFLARKMKVSESQLKRYLKELEEKEWIYRNTYICPTGKKRQIVPKSKLKDFWDHQLSKPSVPEKARKKFLEKTFKPKGHLAQKNSKKDYQGSPVTLAYAKLTSDPCLFTTLEQQYRKAATAAAASFSANVEKELKRSGFAKEEVDAAVQYAKLHPEIEHTKTQPMGWLIQGLKEGWIEEKLQGPQNAEAKKKALWESNKAKAKQVMKALRAKNPKYLRIELNYKQIEFIQLGGRSQCFIIGFDNPRFEIELQKELEKHNLKEIYEVCN